jgi:SAM-dependent methyltransferase
VVGWIASLVRSQILSRAVRYYAERYFPDEGIFVECGCGTGQSSARIARRARRLVALDLSSLALRQARRVSCFTDYLQADIRRLPLQAATVAGLWNLGVVEHFDSAEAHQIFLEFHRVLKPGGVAILFWPPEFGSSRWVLAPLEWLVSKITRRTFHVFPDEVSRLRSKRQAAEMLKAAGLECAAADFSLRVALIHVVVIARRPTI